ncbi:hypothetical protein CC78DRAFT_574049 [Lojkania enalia]|uniref:Uncharacterized protein n=1 Tax=Lojkania enalia TaxID=147567 RepID=A0A9P4TRA3_9PLEO|nr:hypothetical protein CC78DRAFT_574049 [Didymosphaeria enalia]
MPLSQASKAIPQLLPERAAQQMHQTFPSRYQNEQPNPSHQLRHSTPTSPIIRTPQLMTSKSINQKNPNVPPPTNHRPLILTLKIFSLSLAIPEPFFLPSLLLFLLEFPLTMYLFLVRVMYNLDNEDEEKDEDDVDVEIRVKGKDVGESCVKDMVYGRKGGVGQGGEVGGCYP